MFEAAEVTGEALTGVNVSGYNNAAERKPKGAGTN